MSSIAKAYIIETCAILLAALFFYTGLSKLLDWNDTYSTLKNQVFAPWIVELIFYTLPPLEITTAILLVFPKWRKTGLLISLLMMIGFSTYIAIVMTGIFGRIPCSCGGVISKLTWSQHLVFNLIFLSIAFLGTYLQKKHQSPTP